MKDRIIKLKKGFDIKLKGKAEKNIRTDVQSRLYALKPPDLPGLLPIPKLHLEVGDEVKAGDPVFFDKPMPDVQYCAPVSGELVEVRRGAKRAITEIVILADSDINYREFGKADPSSLTREAIVTRMLQSGAWSLMRQRPFHVIPDPTAVPRDIFISCFDTAPLAPDYDFVLQGKETAFQHGINVLRKLTSGGVHLGVSPASSTIFTQVDGVQRHTFSGPHPVGNVGVHIHHTIPINKGEVVWTVKPQDVIIIGRLFTEGIFDAERTVALAGSEVKKPEYIKTRIGASVKPMLEDNLMQDNVRVISGNVLTGTRIAPDGFLSWFDDQITVVEEGTEEEFMGWLFPSYPRPSLSRTFLSFLRPDRAYKVNTNTHGEERAYVMTGEYEKVMPMDIYPVYLIKSIMYRDFDQMEGLGIYEVVEEDLALCEFVCTSKIAVQQILREGLDAMRLEG